MGPLLRSLLALLLGLGATLAAAQPAPATHTLYIKRLAPSGDIASLMMRAPAEQVSRGSTGLLAPNPGGQLMDRAARTPREALEALHRNAVARLEAGDFAAARKLFAEGRELAGRNGDAEGEAACHLGQGVALAAQGDYAGALASTLEARKGYQPLAAPPAPAAASAPRGLAALRELGKLRGAMQQKMQVDSHRLGLEAALLNLGAIHAHSGRWAEAFGAFNEALALFPPGDAPQGAGTVLEALAATSQRLNRPEDARRYAQRAQRAGESLLLLDNYSMFNGQVALRGGQASPAAALPGPGRAEPAAPVNADIAPGRLAVMSGGVQAQVFEKQAGLALAKGDLAAAAAAWRKAVAIATAESSAEGRRSAFAELQALALRQREPALASYYGKRAVNEVQQMRDAQGALDRDARAAFARQVRPGYEALAEGLVAAGRLRETEATLRLMRADAFAEFGASSGRMPLSAAETALAEAHAAFAARWRGNAQARQEIARRMPNFTMAGDPETMAAMRNSRITTAQSSVAALEQTVASVPSEQRAMLAMSMRMQLDSVRRLVDGEAGKPPCPAWQADARAVDLLARVQKLEASLGPAPSGGGAMAALGRPGMPAGLPPGMTPPGGDPADMAKAACLFDEFNALLREADAGEPEAARRLAPASAAEPALPAPAPRTALLHLLVTAERVHLIARSEQGVVARSVAVERKRLDEAVRQLRTQLREPASDPVPAARELYALLVKPVEDELVRWQVQTLVWAPDDALRQLPLAALHDGQRWLVQRWASAVDSPGAESGPRTAAGPWRVAAFGSSLGGAGLDPLPGVTAELNALVKKPGSGTGGVLPGSLWMNEAFTAAALKAALAQRFPVVHIASHFKLVPDRADESFLLLGDGQVLTLPELRRNYRFDGVELVTLSACSSALDHRDGYGQAFEGLGAILRQQGAASVLATMWPVADASTARFMQAFYAARVSGGRSRAEALRSAQLAFVGGGDAADAASQRGGRVSEVVVPQGAAVAARPASVAHPFFWAPFVLSGDWR